MLCFPSLFPSSLCPLGVTVIPKVLPTVTHLSRKGPSIFPAEERQGWHLQATWCFTSLYFWLSHLIFSLVGEFHKTCGVAVAWLPATLCV